jgi:hypothetical protein
MSEQVYKFSLRIDDDKQSLSEHQGLTLKQLGQLLVELDKALELNGKECSLSHISGNCYEMGYSTTNQFTHNNFVSLITNIHTKDLNELPQSQRGFKKSLYGILGSNYYAVAFDNSKTEIATIKADVIENQKLDYYTTDIITGIITQIGSRDIEKQANIVVKEYGSDNTFYIPVSLDQERELIQNYKKDLIVFEVRFKKDLVNNKTQAHSLSGFKVKSNKKLNDKVNAFIEKHGSIFNYLSYADLYNLNEQDDD